MDINICSRGRRRFLHAATVGAATTVAGPVLAQPQAARRYAVLSLIGDQLTVVYQVMGTGSLLDRNVRRPLPDSAGTFDRIALGAVEGSLGKAEPAAEVSLLSVGPSALHEQPDQLFDGKSIALPGNLVDRLEAERSTHVVLLTKLRAEAMLALTDAYLGTGTLRGLGYYIDRKTRVKMRNSGAVFAGFLAAYAYLQLTLADARSGAVLRQRRVTATRVYPVAGNAEAVDPWEVLSADDKVRRMRDLLERQLAQEIPNLIATS